MLDFKWRHFQEDVIMMSVRWYLSYSLSYRDIEELVLERGIYVDHSTIQRWVQKYSIELEESFRKKYKRKEPYVSWRMGERYIKIKGVWFRAVDKHGDTLEFMLSEHRDEESAFNFLRKCIGNHGLPKKITIDKSGANDAALIFLHCFLYLEGL